jgi:predicted permease
MDALIHDLRFAFRTFGRRPGFAVAAVLTLALGIGANTAVFGLVHAVLLRPPAAVASPERLVALFTSDFSGPPFGTSSYPDWQDLRDEAVFTSVAAWSGGTFGVGEPGEVESVDGLAVTTNYFDVLGVTPAAGRLFRGDEEETAGEIVVVSHGLWRERLGARPDVVGSTLRVNGRALEIVGVAPAGFVGFTRTSPAQLWLPIRTAARAGALFGGIEQRSSRGLNMVARLAPGVTLDRAQQAMQLAASRLHAVDAQSWTDVRGEVRRLSLLPESRVRVPPTARDAVVGVAGVLSGAAALVLLLCCANVAGLLLARATSRGREIGVRLSLGAGRRRLLRQLLTESAVLAVLGGTAGVMLAFWTGDLIGRMGDLQGALGVAATIQPDLRLLAFATAVSLGTAALFGIAPALRATRIDLASALRTEAVGAGSDTNRAIARSVLVAGQIAVSVVLLVGAVLLVRTLRSAYAIDPGFATDDVLLVAAAPLPGAESAGDPADVALRIRERFEALPGVQAASWGYASPLTGFGPRRSGTIEGYTPGQGEDMGIHVDHVGPGFFATLEIPIIRGRPIDERDRAGAAGAIVVNQTFARRYLSGRDPIGARIGQGGQEFTVVGVARDARVLSVTEAAPPLLYIPALQMARNTLFYVRTDGDPRSAVAGAAAAIGEVAPGWSVQSIRTMQDQRGVTLGGQRLAGGTVGLFALLALVLAGVGLYGVIAFAVAQRAREIGIRIAVGARPAAVVGLFLRQAVGIVSAGLLLGLVAALAAVRALAGLLIGVAPADPVSFAAAAVILGLIALFATWWPARRAANIDPMRALRTE